jgi:hypothetical protein
LFPAATAVSWLNGTWQDDLGINTYSFGRIQVSAGTIAGDWNLPAEMSARPSAGLSSDDLYELAFVVDESIRPPAYCKFSFAKLTDTSLALSIEVEGVRAGPLTLEKQ